MRSRLLSAGRAVRHAAERLRPAFAHARGFAVRFAATRPGRVLVRIGLAAIAVFAPAWRWRYAELSAAAVVMVSVFSGSVEGTDRTLVVMGFDPDRAQLITALIIGGTAAAAAALVRSRALAASLLGTAGVAALYAQTFAAETDNALNATGPAGAFDAFGWVLTLLTLLVIGATSAWIGSTLALSVRPGLIATGSATVRLCRWVWSLRGSAPARPDRQWVTRPLAALLIIVLLVICVPVFGDMVNLSPDALMLNGVPRPLVPDGPAAGATATPGPTPTQTAAPTPQPTPTTPAGSIAPSASATAVSTWAGGTAAPGSKPWLAWKPAGKGDVTIVKLPAPWVGGLADVSEISIYTPAGYSDSGNGRYPVVYEAPTGLPLWGKGTNVVSALDTMIAGGDIPASIVVFIDSANAPNTDSQCADASDGSQWFEKYISETVPAYIDSHFRTIPDRGARAIMGMSAGGYCAPMLALRHRGVFGTSISFSGYFYAGAAGSNARRPFASQADMDAHSPVLLAPQVPAAERAGLYFVVVANLPQRFYGPAASEFENVLQADGYGYLGVDSLFTHGWTEVRYETPVALKAWAAHMVVAGVW